MQGLVLVLASQTLPPYLQEAEASGLGPSWLLEWLGRVGVAVVIRWASVSPPPASYPFGLPSYPPLKFSLPFLGLFRPPRASPVPCSLPHYPL